jgi:hypothetical protein
MADKNIVKSKVRPLPEFSGSTGKYRLRYRIISEDRNRTSHWSQIHEVSVPAVTPLTASQYKLIVEETSTAGLFLVNLIWEGNNTYLFSYYDVYIAYDSIVIPPLLPSNSEYSYLTRVTDRSFSTYISTEDYDNFSVMIHSPTYDKIINNSQILLKTPRELLPVS